MGSKKVKKESLKKIFEEKWIRYEGMFLKNEMNGIGYLYFNEKNYYLGEFKNNKANGLGVYFNKDKK